MNFDTLHRAHLARSIADGVERERVPSSGDAELDRIIAEMLAAFAHRMRERANVLERGMARGGA